MLGAPDRGATSQERTSAQCSAVDGPRQEVGRVPLLHGSERDLPFGGELLLGEGGDGVGRMTPLAPPPVRAREDAEPRIGHRAQGEIVIVQDLERPEPLQSIEG